MIGQNGLKTLISSFTKETFPQVVLLCGEEGCGKHTFITECVLPIINPYFVEDITDRISFDFFMSAEVDTRDVLYVVDIRKITEEKQNSLLKFLEEPPESCHIVLLSKYSTDVIPTIFNRCYVIEFATYSVDELFEYCDRFCVSRDFVSIANTPGKLEAYKKYNISEVEQICKTLFKNAKSAQLSNLFSLSSRLDWNNSGDGYNLGFFFAVATNVCFEMYKNREISQNVFRLTKNICSNIFSAGNTDKKRQFDKYIIDLKYERF